MPSARIKKTASAPNKTLPAAAGIFLLAGFVLAWPFIRKSYDCWGYQTGGHYSEDRQIVAGGVTLTAELANDPKERAIGLSGRPCIYANQAMLFEFGQPGRHAFWMKGMEFPIDIIWLDERKQIVKVEHAIQPSTYPNRYINDAPASYVLETKAGMAERLKLAPGVTLKF